MVFQILHHPLTKSQFLCYTFHCREPFCDWLGVVTLLYLLALCFSISLFPIYCTSTILEMHAFFQKEAADAILTGTGGVLFDIDSLEEIHLPVPKRSGQAG